MSRIMIGGSAGLMMMMALPRFAPPTFSTAPAVVRVNSSMFCRVPGPTDLDATVATISAYSTGWTRKADGGDHRDGGLAAAAHHADIHFARPDVRLEVHRRDAIRAERGRREIDDHHAVLAELASVLAVRVGTRGVKGDSNVVSGQVLEEAVDTGGRRLQPHAGGALQAIGRDVDADHPERRDPLRSASPL